MADKCHSGGYIYVVQIKSLRTTIIYAQFKLLLFMYAWFVPATAPLNDNQSVSGDEISSSDLIIMIKITLRKYLSLEGFNSLEGYICSPSLTY